MAQNDDSSLPQPVAADLYSQAREQAAQADRLWSLARDYAFWGLADEAALARTQSRAHRVTALLLRAQAYAPGLSG